MMGNIKFWLYLSMFSVSLCSIIYFLANGIIDKKWNFLRFFLILIIGNMIYLSAYYIIIKYNPNEVKELTSSVNSCDELSRGMFTEKGLDLINKAIKENSKFVCGKHYIDSEGRMYFKADNYIDGKIGIHKIDE
ncbi:hypothetical protein GKR75_07875 [Providencia sp. wls1919]|nr:hypothetical protein [Providencia sp. wls1919]